MTTDNRPSRRGFLASGLAIPAAAAAAGSQLQYGVLGKTGLKVTRLGFGCLAVSDPSVIARALDMGINFFDTARSYQRGNSERMLGAALKGRRKDVILETKSTAPTRDAALQELDASLKELGTDYVDIWHLHSKNSPADLKDELLEAQRTAKQQGKIRFAGVSTHVQTMIAHIQKLGQTDVILLSYNFSMPAEMGMEKTIESARRAGIGIIAMKAMAGGFNRMQRWDDGSAIGRESRVVFIDPKVMMQKQKQPGVMPAALRWVFKNKDVDTAIVGIVDTDQLEEDFAAMSAPFTDADQKLLVAQLDRIGPLYCRMCGSCTGKCSQGLPVADMLRVLAYADGYGQFALARESFQGLGERAAQARCTDCSACAIQCPNGVRVPERIRKAQEWLA